MLGLSISKSGMTEKPPRGICCHEAAHAVVAWSFALPVEEIYVVFDDLKGWFGGTDISAGSDSKLSLNDQITNLAAGKTGEEVFACSAHEKSWLQDLGRVYKLLCGNNIPEEEHWSRIKVACDRASPILETHRHKVLKLIDRLAERGRVERSEFLQLMNREE